MKKACEYCDWYESDFSEHCESCRSDDGICNLSNFKLNNVLAEWHRLATIGAATEKAFEKGMILIEPNNYSECNYRYEIAEDTAELLEWYAEQEQEGTK